MLKFDLPKAQSSIIKVIGVGGGGNNAVNHMFELGIKDVDFINCNTDQQVLEASPVPTKIRFGSRGLGTGANPEFGKKLAEESIEDIREILEKNTQLLFITAGMGGGTGTGAAPVVAQVARELDILTVGIVTEPFSFEGKRRRVQALKGIQELRKYVDVLLVIKNDKLREQYGDLKITEAFHKADDILTNAAKGMAEIISSRGYINVDFEDAKTVMRNSATAIMGLGKASGEDRASRVVEEAINSPLLDNKDLSGAKKILLYITYGEDEVSMDELGEIVDLVNERTGNLADINMGQGYDPSLGNNIAIALIVTGFNIPEEKFFDPDIENEKKSNEPEKISEELRTVIPLNNEVKIEEPQNPKLQDNSNLSSYKIEKVKMEEITEIQLLAKAVPKEEEQIERYPVSQPRIISQPQETPPAQPIHQQPIKVIKSDEFDDYELPETRIYPIRAPQNEENRPYSYSDEEDPMASLGPERRRFMGISFRNKSRSTQESMENEPAYIRRKVKFEDVPSSAESQISRYSLFEGENGVEVRSANSFLHDNVD
ncbi:MAG: cell division protein FtsZ [Bacteroidales bacterium]|nr:cell division protein FtsZ [Bacteroidales bacterium]